MIVSLLRHPKFQDRVHGARGDDSLSGRTRVHSPKTPKLPDRSIRGPFGLCTITRAEYYAEIST